MRKKLKKVIKGGGDQRILRVRKPEKVYNETKIINGGNDEDNS